MTGCTNVRIVLCVGSITGPSDRLGILLFQLTSDLLLHDQGHVRLQEEENVVYNLMYYWKISLSNNWYIEVCSFQQVLQQ